VTLVVDLLLSGAILFAASTEIIKYSDDHISITVVAGDVILCLAG
jgi:hypothetical protein